MAEFTEQEAKIIKAKKHMQLEFIQIF